MPGDPLNVERREKVFSMCGTLDSGQLRWAMQENKWVSCDTLSLGLVG